MKTKKDTILYLLTIIVTLLLSFGVKLGFSSKNILANASQVGKLEMSDFYNSVGNDVYLSQQNYCNDVTIVNIDGCGIEELPNVIKSIESFSPKVIGIDVLFYNKHPKNVDSSLLNAIMSCNKVVTACEIIDNKELVISPILKYTGIKSAVVNLQDPVVRHYWPQFIVSDTLMNSFAMELVYHYAPDKYKEQLEKNNGPNHIRIIDFFCDTISYNTIIEVKEKRMESITKMLENRIVIIGSCNNPKDMHRTSVNSTMSGPLIHAAIIYSILNLKDDYINEYPWLNYLLAILVTAGFSWLTIYFRKKYSTGGNLMIRALQIIILLIGIWAGASFYIYGHLYLNLSTTLLSVGLVYIGYDIVFGFNELIRRTINKRKK